MASGKTLFLILANAHIAVTEFVDLVLILVLDSDELIQRFNGHLLFDSTFRAVTIGVLSLLVLTALFSAATNLFAFLSERDKFRNPYGRYGYKLIKLSAMGQFMVVLIMIAIQVRLLTNPAKLQLKPRDWEQFIANYEYPSHVNTTYSHPIDRLQRSIGCCGYRSPTEWTQARDKTGWLAPSCCSEPDGLGWSLVDENGSPKGMLVFCKSLDHWLATRRDSHGLDAPVGCQQRLNERHGMFLFLLRLRLLVLTCYLFCLCKFALIHHHPNAPASRSHHQHSHQTRRQTSSSAGSYDLESAAARLQRRAADKQADDDDDYDDPPPDYYQAIGATAT